MKNDGKNYEEFVGNLQQALLDSETVTNIKSVNIEKNKKIIDKNGISREFDLYWEYEIAGVIHKNIIECKDYMSKVSIDKIDALLGKLQDIPGIKPLFATKTGYQSGAEIKASQHDIDLLIVRESNDSDWEGQIKKIHLSINVQEPARILDFMPYVDKECLAENKSTIPNKVLDDEIFIDDLEKGEYYSLMELSSKLTPLNRGTIKKGVFEEVVEFKNGYILYDKLRLKLRAYKIKYEILEPIKTERIEDFSKEMIGVIEYLGRNYKKAIFNNGKIRKINKNN